MVGEAATCFLQQVMHVARRDAKPPSNYDCAQRRIAAAALDCLENRRSPRRANAAIFRRRARLATGTECKRNQIDDVLFIELRGTRTRLDVEIEGFPDIAEQ